MSDIRKFAVESTGRLQLRSAADELLYAEDADGSPDPSKPMVAVLYGPGSKQYAKAQAAQQNRMIDKLKRKGKTDETEAEKREQQADFLTACTAALENVEYEALTGEALFKAVYSDITIGFIAEQVAKHLGDWGNFTKGSTKS